jgi:trigger factor
LSVEVEDVEFAKDIDAAFRKLALEVRLPGFRPGKAPRKILEARIGLGPAREQALRDAIPQYLAKAVREHEVDLIAAPDLEITGGADEGVVTFDATCEVRPVVSVPGYAGLRIELPNPAATDAEVQDALDSERRRHGTLTVVERPAAKGDFVTMDLEAHRDGEPVPGLNTEDWLYEVGRGWVAEGFDDHLIGATANDTLTFSATPSGTAEAADFSVKIGNVQELVLPEATDEWVADNLPEHDSVEAWTQSVRDRIAAVRLNQGRQALIERATTALAALVDEEPPQAMVDQ